MNVDINKIAKLARLSLKDEEAKLLQSNLDEILKYVEQLNQLDTKDVPPTSHVLNIENVFRVDDIKPWPVRDELLRYAPKKEKTYFKVPKVIEEV